MGFSIVLSKIYKYIQYFRQSCFPNLDNLKSFINIPGLRCLCGVSETPITDPLATPTVIKDSCEVN